MTRPLSSVRHLKAAKISRRGAQAAGGAALVLAALLAGCATSPEYRAPQVNTGKGWAQPANTAATGAALATWWCALGDPVLDRLVESALAHNLDIREARARIAEARALRDAAAGAELPSLQAAARIDRRRQSLNGPLPIGSIPGVSRDQTIHDVGFDAAWEVDLFGRVRHSVQSAQARFQATQEAANGIRVSVAAEVARAYLSMRGAQRELSAQTALVRAMRGIAETVRKRVASGDLARSENERWQERIDAAAAELPGLRARVRAAALGIAVLLGRLPESGLALERSKGVEIRLRPIPVGERADVLRRRPDVRFAERRLAAATADVGVASAEWFPRLSISASGGFQALALGDLLNSSSEVASVVPLITWRVFDGGRVRAQIHAAQARQAAAARAYEKAVLSALSDAERALSNYRFSLASVRLQRAAAQAARRSYDHSRRRFDHGDIALGDLLEAQLAVHRSQEAYERAHTHAAIELVALYKALGGGWPERAP